jgi:thiol-disulfide isomerase/thioredoxin
MRLRLILSTLATAALVALTGCGSGGKDGVFKAAPGKVAEAAPEKAVEAAPGKVAEAPPAAANAVPASLTFTGRTLDGKAFDASSLAGRPVVLWFWAPWCATCASEAQSLSTLAPRYKGRVDFVGVAGMGGEKAMKAFVADYEVGMIPQLVDTAGTVWRKFAIAEQSTYVVLDRKGNIVEKGWLDDQAITATVAKLAAS